MKGPLQNLDSGRWARTWLQLLQKRKMHFMNNRGIRRKLLMSPVGTKVGTKGADKIICLHFEKFPTAFGTAHAFQPRYRDCMCQMVQCARWYSAVCWRGQAFWPRGWLLMFMHSGTCWETIHRMPRLVSIPIDPQDPAAGLKTVLHLQVNDTCRVLWTAVYCIFKKNFIGTL